MFPEIDADATIGRSASSLQGPSATSTVQQQDVESSSISNGVISTTRRRSRKAVPPVSEDARPSTGRRVSHHRRSSPILSMEAVRAKGNGGLPKSTGCHTNVSKASVSRKTSKDILDLASNRTVVSAKRQVHGHSDADVSFVALDRPDDMLCDLGVDRVAPDTVSQFVESPRKKLDELLSTLDRKHEQTKTKEESKAPESSSKAKLSPLQDLSLNTGLGRPPVGHSPPLTPPGVKWTIVTPGFATNLGFVQLSADELAMEISFYQNRHFEVWDMRDSAHVHFPVQVNLVVKNADRWAHKPLLLPDIRMLDIQCCTQAKLSIYSEFDPEASYSVCYTGARFQDDQGKPLPLMHENGITIEPEWVRSNVKTIGKGNPNERGVSIGKRGWYLKIWVPIPMKLLVKRETRGFVLRVCVWIGGDDGDFVESKEEMTVSHLRMEKEMK